MWNTEILWYESTIRVDWLLNISQNLLPNTLRSEQKTPKVCHEIVHVSVKDALFTDDDVLRTVTKNDDDGDDGDGDDDWQAWRLRDRWHRMPDRPPQAKRPQRSSSGFSAVSQMWIQIQMTIQIHRALKKSCYVKLKDEISNRFR